MDQEIRLSAFEWLGTQVAVHGDVLPWALLHNGFTFRQQTVHLIGQQGIFKPALCDLPISITSKPPGKDPPPYADEISGNLILYKYRGTDPQHHDNLGLKEAMRRKVPLIYFYGVEKGFYLAIWPVFITAADDSSLTFTVLADDASVTSREFGRPEEDEFEALGRRRYITTTTLQRAHQRGFRYRVLRAYRERCAMCRLAHVELLDAAHIIGDREEGGDPHVQNGLALCKIHHAAFDKHIIGVAPNYEVVVRDRVLLEVDGPMLRHGLQGLHGAKIELPRSERDQPDRERLERRFDIFKRAG